VARRLRKPQELLQALIASAVRIPGVKPTLRASGRRLM